MLMPVMLKPVQNPVRTPTLIKSCSLIQDSFRRRLVDITATFIHLLAIRGALSPDLFLVIENENIKFSDASEI